MTYFGVRYAGQTLGRRYGNAFVVPSCERRIVRKPVVQ
jgi:hypothetical protein